MLYKEIYMQRQQTKERLKPLGELSDDTQNFIDFTSIFASIAYCITRIYHAGEEVDLTPPNAVQHLKRMEANGTKNYNDSLPMLGIIILTFSFG